MGRAMRDSFVIDCVHEPEGSRRGELPPVWGRMADQSGRLTRYAPRRRKRRPGLVLIEPCPCAPWISLASEKHFSITHAFFTTYLVRPAFAEPDAIGLMIDFWFGAEAYAKLSSSVRGFLNLATARNADDVRAAFGRLAGGRALQPGASAFVGTRVSGSTRACADFAFRWLRFSTAGCRAGPRWSGTLGGETSKQSAFMKAFVQGRAQDQRSYLLGAPATRIGRFFNRIGQTARAARIFHRLLQP